MRLHTETERWTLYHGDALEVLWALPSESVQVVTAVQQARLAVGDEEARGA